MAVTAAGIGAALREQQRDRRPLAPLWRGRPGVEWSSCATVSGDGGGAAAPVLLPSPSVAGVGLQGPGSASCEPPGLGAERRGPWQERSRRGSGLHVSSFGALSSWGPFSPGPCLGTEPGTPGPEAGGS